MRKKNNIEFLYLPVVFLFLFTKPVISETINLGELKENTSRGIFVDYLEDHEGRLSFEDIRGETSGPWTRSDKQNPGFGFTASIYWVKFTVKNNTNTEKEYLLEQGYPLINNLDIYIPEKDGYRVIHSGASIPFNDRIYKHRNLIYPLKFKPDSSSTFYLKYRTGTSMNVVLRLWPTRLFEENAVTEYHMLFLIYGIIFIMMIYNLLIYFFIKRLEYLFYVLFILSLLLLMMGLDGTSYQYLWPNYPWWANVCRPYFLCLLVIFLFLFASFLTGIHRNDESKNYRKLIYKSFRFRLYFYILILLVCIISPYRIAMIISSITAGVEIGMICMYGTILIIKEHSRPTIFGFVAASTIIIGGIAYILKTFGVLPTNFFTQWSLHLGAVFMITIFSISLADRINIMRINIHKTERKYRNLVESSNDIIFSLDEDLRFTSVNSAMERYLGFKTEEVLGKKFIDFIQETWSKTAPISRMITNEYLNEIKRTGKGSSFKIDFKTKYSLLPKELSVRIDLVETSDEEEMIQGKASPIDDDIILNFLDSEKHTYTLDNYLNNAELLSQRITRNLNRFIDNNEITQIKISLREMMINAIEHGNLSIQFEEKTKAKESGNYISYLQDRQMSSKYRDKKIHIEYQLSEEMVKYIITDEGEGFDHTAFLNSDPENSNMKMLEHGRGIRLTQEIFDEVYFNEKGNQVTLIKHFGKEAHDAS